MKVTVISGGFSEEQNSSRESGRHIAQALRTLGHSVDVAEYDEHLPDNIRKFSPDAVFPIVQGKYHGDGAVQALLELIGIPYVGTRPHNAAVINHKTICKKIWRAEGIPTPEFFEYSFETYKKDSFDDFAARVKAGELTLPVVVKPPTQGGRFGIVFVKDSAGFRELEASFRYDETLLVERYVEGRFITQGIIEIDGKMTNLPPIEVIDTSGAEFKLFNGGSRRASADVNFTQERLAEINRITSKAAFLTGASGFARLDYHLSGDKLYLLEINAVPTLVPDYGNMCISAMAGGYDYVSFIGMLLAAAKDTGKLRRTKE